MDWCDPLDIRVDEDGDTAELWPPFPEYGPDMGKAGDKVDYKPLGPRAQGESNAGYAFEVKASVFGDSTDCKSRQAIKITVHVEYKNKKGETIQATYRSPTPSGADGDLFGDDDYHQNYRARHARTQDKGTESISWIDVPGLVSYPGVTNAQAYGEVIDVVSGTESPLVHDHLESSEEGGGETAWVRFKFCVVRKPPEGTDGDAFKRVDEKGPDDTEPADFTNRQNPGKKDTTERPKGNNPSKIKGCDGKTGGAAL